MRSRASCPRFWPARTGGSIAVVGSLALVACLHAPASAERHHRAHDNHANASNPRARKATPPATQVTTQLRPTLELAPERESPAEVGDWRASLANGDYATARRQLESAQALSPRPELRLALAKTLIELAEFNTAYATLTDLENDLPGAQALIKKLRRRAALNSDQVRQLLPELTKSRNADELLQVAEHLLDAGELKEADALIRRAAAFTRRSTDKNARLRKLRVRWAKLKGFKFLALRDLRWLALEAPAHALAQGVDDAIAASYPNAPLSGRERRFRAEKFAEGGHIDLLERELDRLKETKFYRLRAGDEAHLRGRAAYKARDFVSAARWLRQAAQLGNPKGSQDRYFAARALSRLGQPIEALELLKVASKGRPQTRLNRLATFRIAREYSLLGDWQAALGHYNDFLRRYPDSEYVESAKREHAIALFALGEPRRASYRFRELYHRNPRARDANLYRLLQAVALLFAGDGTQAKELFRQLHQRSPLSFVGLSARARLAELGEYLAEPTNRQNSPWTLPLPDEVFAFQQLGFHDEAQSQLRSRERALRRAHPMRADEAVCETYAQLEFGHRRFQVGLSAARKLSFFFNPKAAPNWLWRCLYPTPHRKLVRTSSEQFSVPEALVYAVMRQESAFRPQVRSPANAWGLMQIIPPTGKMIAKTLNIPFDKTTLLYPKKNVRMGTYYLRKLLNAFEQHPALAAAAYNAGPEATSHWEYAGRQLPLELFVARIPYKETRGYVQKVLANLATYQELYGELDATDIPLWFGDRSRMPELPLSSPEITLIQE